MKSILLFVFFVFSSFFSLAYTPIEDIRLIVKLINDVDGNEIKTDVTITVTDVQSGKVIALKSAKGKKFYEISAGNKFKVVALASGFYTEEKEFDSKEKSDLDIIEIRLKPRTAGSIMVKAIDKNTSRVVGADFELSANGKILKGKSTAANSEFNFLVEKAGAFKLVTYSPNYNTDTREVEIVENQGNISITVSLMPSKIPQSIDFYSVNSNAVVETGKAIIKSKDKNFVVYDGQFKNGKLSFEGKPGETFNILINAEGYNTLQEIFVLDGEPRKIGLSANASIDIDVFDEETKERIEGDILITSPSGKTSKIRSSKISSTIFSPKELGTYSIESAITNYQNRSGTVIMKNLVSGKMFYSLMLKKGNNEFVVSVFDAQTKKPIDNALIKVFNNDSKEVNGKSSKNSKFLRLDLDKKYFFEVTAVGYLDYTQNINNERVVNVYLQSPKRDTLDSFNIQVIDFQSKLPVDDAKVFVSDENKKAQKTEYATLKKQFSIKRLDTKGDYNIEATAKAYKTGTQKIDMKALPDNIILTPVDVTIYNFKANDGFTKKPIEKVAFDIYTKNVKIVLEEDFPITKAKIAAISDYSFDAAHPDYINVKKPLNKLEFNGDELVVNMYRKIYAIVAKISPQLDENQQKTLKYSINKKLTNEQAKISFSKAENAILGEINHESAYLISVAVDGFESFSTTFSLKDVNSSTLEYEVKLTEKKKLALNEPKKEPEKEVKKPEPPKPVDTNASLEIVAGKHFPLEGVNFEKSKTFMVAGADKKLMPLVDYLKAHPKSTIEIIGHTDNEGTDQRLNQRLSEFRAKVVGNFLFNKGISTSRIKTIGKGSEEPLVPNDTDENRSKNRRIEAFIIEN